MLRQETKNHSLASSLSQSLDSLRSSRLCSEDTRVRGRAAKPVPRRRPRPAVLPSPPSLRLGTNQTPFGRRKPASLRSVCEAHWRSLLGSPVRSQARSAGGIVLPMHHDSQGRGAKVAPLLPLPTLGPAALASVAVVATLGHYYHQREPANSSGLTNILWWSTEYTHGKELP